MRIGQQTITINNCKSTSDILANILHPSYHISNIPHLEHPKSRTSQIANISHLEHSTPPTFHIPNIPHPEHLRSSTSHISNIPQTKHPTFPAYYIANISYKSYFIITFNEYSNTCWIVFKHSFNNI